MKLKTIKSYDILASMRMDGSFHLSDTVIIEKIIDKIGYQNLSFYSERIFTAGRNKRVYTKNDFGYPYLSNSDVISQYPFLNCKFNSKKYGYDYNSLLQEGMIVTGRVGAIGQTAYITSEFEVRKSMGSDNIIRIVPKDKSISGFLYAYLASRIGKTFLWKHATGGVQPYINEEMVGSIPVPTFPEDKQLEIHNLIVESAELRVEANKALAVAHNQINDILAINDLQSKNIGRKSLKTILKSHNCRFEANYFQSKGYDLREKIIENYNFKTLGEITSDIFRPGIFKRTYVEKGTTFLGGSDITKAIPDSEKKLSKTKTQGLSDLMLKKHWILITCGGTIGNMAYVDSELEKCAASQHILRIVSSKVLSGYLFAFLSSNIGKEIIQSYTYGSVIPQIEPHHISGIPIPIFNQETEQGIHELVMQYVEKIENSKIKELQAIQLVENEIEQWQH